MTVNHEYGPDLSGLNAGIHKESANEEEEVVLPDAKPRNRDIDREFYQKIRQDTPPDSDLSRHTDLESESGRKYDND